MANTIRNEMERIQRIYDGAWKTIELNNGPWTCGFTWKERFKIFFKGSITFNFKFTCSMKGDAYIHNPKVEYKRYGN